tara:strand:- start:101 stop:571 length:471 start_codon:yes stop_codon:yes gene_type:complete
MKDTREFLWVFDHSDNVIYNYPLSGDDDYDGDLPMYDCLVETEESFLTRRGFVVSTITTPGNIDWMVGRVAGCACCLGDTSLLRTYNILVSRAIESAKSQIVDDIKTGVIKSKPTSFSDLHDYVDANFYGGMEFFSSDLPTMNRIQSELDVFIKEL